jgi:hypothetical protein
MPLDRRFVTASETESEMARLRPEWAFVQVSGSCKHAFTAVFPGSPRAVERFVIISPVIRARFSNRQADFFFS